MIAGSLNHLQPGLMPDWLRNILHSNTFTLANLASVADGRYQKPGADWFYTISSPTTAYVADRHTEYHRQYIDVQLLLEGEEIINYGIQNVTGDAATETKPDLYILEHPELSHAVHLHPGEFAVFTPGEAHQALCAPVQPATIRKAVIKIPVADFLEI